MSTKKTNLNFKIFLTSIFLIFIFSLSISSITNAGRITPDDCSCAKNLTAGQTCQNSLGETCFGSNPKPANTCGNDIKEGSEECDFNSAFGPYPNQCPNNGACNQATCKCSSGSGTTGTNPTPTTGPASFSADKTSGNIPLTVNFTLTNGTNCINYMCYTGVGVDNSKYVYEKSFSCTYNTAGTYTASISCNGNKITKTITATGVGAGTTPTPTVTSTPTPTPNPNSPNVKPADCVSFSKFYPRAPEDVEMYSFGGAFEYMLEYLPYFRVFVPPGAISLDLTIQNNAKMTAVERYKIPPTGLPEFPSSDVSTAGAFSLQQLEDSDYWSTDRQSFLSISNDAFLSPYLPVSRAGWLYVKVSPKFGTVIYSQQFSVRVDPKTYNAWWDKYIKDEAGWNKYIENVETYIDPTIETKTPTCKANFSKTDITAPGESKLSFSSENTTKLIGSCTGPLPIKELDLPLSYTNYPFPFTINQTGTETCTFTPYNGTTKGESCSATVTVKNSTTSNTEEKPICESLIFNPASIKVDEETKIAWQFGGGYTKTTPTKVQCSLSITELTSITGIEEHGTLPTGNFNKSGTDICKIYFNDSTTPACESNALVVSPANSTSPASTPTPTPNLCGNGKKDTGESCDPKSTTYDCAEFGATCNAKCQCIQNPTPTPQNSRSCQRDNPDCEKVTCNNVYCFDGCERIKGTRVCDGS